MGLENRLLERCFEVVCSAMDFLKSKPMYPVHLNRRFGDAVDRFRMGVDSGTLADLRQQVPTCRVGCCGLKPCPFMEG